MTYSQASLLHVAAMFLMQLLVVARLHRICMAAGRGGKWSMCIAAFVCCLRGFHVA